MLNFNRKKNAMMPCGNEVALTATAEIVDEIDHERSCLRPSLQSATPYIRNTSDEIIVEYVPAGATLHVDCGGARVLVLGNVGAGAEIVAEGGGARIEILGDVAPGVRIGAKGGGAHVMIVGAIAPDVQIAAQGGGARIEFFSPASSQYRTQGGGAEVLHLY